MAIVYNGHYHARVIDNECDNHIVWGSFRGQDGILYLRADQDGCAGGGTDYSFPTPIVRYQICEENEGCSAIYAT